MPISGRILLDTIIRGRLNAPSSYVEDYRRRVDPNASGQQVWNALSRDHKSWIASRVGGGLRADMPWAEVEPILLRQYPDSVPANERPRDGSGGTVTPISGGQETEAPADEDDDVAFLKARLRRISDALAEILLHDWSE